MPGDGKVSRRDLLLQARSLAEVRATAAAPAFAVARPFGSTS
jgi:hypothetical protein